MAHNPIVLVHGYSDRGKSFKKWASSLTEHGFDVKQIYVGNYVSLSNEVTLKDLAEGFDRALRREAGLSSEQPFDAIVHSTGMLVVRSWLTSYTASYERKKRLKRLIALAPASFGSPLAHKGRSWLGSVFKGTKRFGPDFMEAGNEVLDALELGSKITWDLAHADLIGDEPVFVEGTGSPFVFTFCGNRGYRGLSSAIYQEGSDGTVRWSGCTLNARKVVVNLTADISADAPPRVSLAPWGNPAAPFVAVDDADHGSILREPSAELVQQVVKALKVETTEQLQAWSAEAKAASLVALSKMGRWQQFVIRVLDERGDPVRDWNMQLFTSSRKKSGLKEFDMDVHVYDRDESLRCFHVDLDRLEPESVTELHLKLIASSGTELVEYFGVGSERVTASGTRKPGGKWDAQIDLSSVLNSNSFQFFFPFTTTLVEIRVNREPMPLHGPNSVFWFSKRS